ncbi:MAG: biopolymer transporter ExbD [Treponema sp.]|nr:biopolymer transporter ExbD [Treponema sp.]
MKIRKKHKFVSVPLFSTSDIAFLLLIFIMLVSLINYRVEVKIEYPEAQRALRTTAEKNLELWINYEGDIFLDGIASDFLALENKIAHLYVSAPDTRVHIIADKNTPYENINNVLEILQILQYRVVSFVVKTNE